MTSSPPIVDSDRLVARFGGWPSFHDAEVLWLRLDRRGGMGPQAEMLVHVWATTNRVDTRGYFERKNHTLALFRFDGLEETDLGSFNGQNVMSMLSFEPHPVESARGVRVNLDGIYGLSGTILCRQVVVADVTPCNENGEPTT